MHHAVFILKVIHHLNKRSGIICQRHQIEFISGGGYSGRDHQPLLIAGDRSRNIPADAVVSPENEFVFNLLCSQPVEIEFVLLRLAAEHTALLGFVIARIEKALIAEPGKAGKLHIPQRILYDGSVLCSHRDDFTPVAPALRDLIGDHASVFGKAHPGKGGGAVL